MVGASRTTFGSLSLPHALGGGCELLVAMDLIAPLAVGGSGLGGGTASIAIPIPSDPRLLGFVAYAQAAQVDHFSTASLPVTFSNAGAIVLY